MTHWQRILSILLMLVGLGSVTLAVAVELLDIGRPGFDAKQILLILFGVVTLLGGGSLVTSVGQRYIQRYRRIRWSYLLLLLASAAISFVIGEFVLQWDDLFVPPPYPPTCKGDTCALYQEFKPYGYRLWPSSTKNYFYPLHNPRSLTVISNKHGFRNSREFDESDAQTRIVVVGDSFVFGEGVEEAERFTNVLETTQPTWRVDSIGLPGYGPDLMLRALEEVGLAPEPDVVVFSMYTDDFRRVKPYYAGIGFEIPRFELESGQLVTVSYPQPRPWDRLHTFQAVKQIYWNYTKTEWALNEAILDRFLNLADIHAFKPAVIFLPGIQDTIIDKQRREWLKKYTQDYGVPFLDLTDPIHTFNRDTVFIKRNPHYNPYGHQIVAEALHRLLAEQVLKTQ